MAAGLCQSSVGGAGSGDAAWLLLQGICSHEPPLELNPNCPAYAFVHDLFRIVGDIGFAVPRCAIMPPEAGNPGEQSIWRTRRLCSLWDMLELVVGTFY